MSPTRTALLMACLASGCTIQANVFPVRDGSLSDARPELDAGTDASIPDAGHDAGVEELDAGPADAGRPIRCVPGPPDDAEPIAQLPGPVAIDGAFTGTEWDGVEPLEGLYADVYLDVRGGDLVLLNDWRGNQEGIELDCFNRFELTVAGRPMTIRVFGDGRVEVDGATSTVAGAAGFGPSPRNPDDHTIYELSVSDVETPTDVCLFDPLTLAGCAALAQEPMVFSVVTSLDDRLVAQRSTRSSSLPRLGDGALCANGDGVCEAGLRCSPPSPERRCVP